MSFHFQLLLKFRNFINLSNELFNFSLRIAMRVVLWKNRALATLAREREDKDAFQRRKQYIQELFVKTSKAGTFAEIFLHLNFSFFEKNEIEKVFLINDAFERHCFCKCLLLLRYLKL